MQRPQGLFHSSRGSHGRRSQIPRRHEGVRGETDPGFPAGATYSTKDQPIQSFQWSDYSAKPGHDYTYTIAALKGTPRDLKIFAETSVDITTESPEGGDQDVYFNRGVAASQEYARRFGNRAPDKVPNNQAFIWLSRGLYEALEAYVESCGRGDRLRIAAYEFHYEPFLKLLKKAESRGVDVKVVFDKRKADPGEANTNAIKDTGIGAFCTPRKKGKSYISHNKFIVKMKGNKALSVWTGGTNFSSGGIFGHSNVGHRVEDPAVAERYLTYWNMLAEDPDTPEARDRVDEITKVQKLPPPKGTSVIFSPRKGLEALQYYAKLAASADQALFMTFAFGINKLFKDVYRTSRAPFRMALLEKATRPMKDGPEKKKEEQDIQQLRNMPENTFAIGDFIRTTAVDGWLKEKLSGLNSNVRYVHNKFMLVDPLSDDPIVVAGSANFSDASTTNNDENMIVVRGNKRIADIYFGEYMRLYSHHAFRESLKWRDDKKPPKPLEHGDWWRDYFGTTERSVRRRYFARSST
ncbi:phospholipase D-like domain-containing protein [Bradyrhizobium sp. 27S5]|uniref:phospholipase D-like domain-containing protein n=1 Tax=Bradyrhizobium sp. 27S5 TaxID=3139728 RepID=UPI0030CDC597